MVNVWSSELLGAGSVCPVGSMKPEGSRSTGSPKKSGRSGVLPRSVSTELAGDGGASAASALLRPALKSSSGVGDVVFRRFAELQSGVTDRPAFRLGGVCLRSMRDGRFRVCVGTIDGGGG